MAIPLDDREQRLVLLKKLRHEQRTRRDFYSVCAALLAVVPEAEDHLWHGIINSMDSARYRPPEAEHTNWEQLHRAVTDTTEMWDKFHDNMEPWERAFCSILSDSNSPEDFYKLAQKFEAERKQAESPT